MKKTKLAGLLIAASLLVGCSSDAPSKEERFTTYTDSKQCLYDFGYHADNFEVLAAFLTDWALIQTENRRNALILCRDFLTIKEAKQ